MTPEMITTYNILVTKSIDHDLTAGERKLKAALENGFATYMNVLEGLWKRELDKLNDDSEQSAREAEQSP
jgi:hypothetical protein